MPTFAAVRRLGTDACGIVGIDINTFTLEYPLQALLREKRPEVQFVHTGVQNVSVKYAFRQPTQPCAVLCLKCAGDNERLNAYRGYRQMLALGDVVLFLR